MRTPTILWGAVALLVWRLPVAGAQENEQAKLQGAWYNLSAESDGKQQTGEDKSNLHIIIGNKVVTEVEGRMIQESIFTLEPGEKFGRITFQMVSGPDKGRTWIGIYQLDGDTLKWCGAWKGENDRLPTDFATQEGDRYFLRVMKLLKR